MAVGPTVPSLRIHRKSQALTEADRELGKGKLLVRISDPIAKRQMLRFEAGKLKKMISVVNRRSG